MKHLEAGATLDNFLEWYEGVPASRCLMFLKYELGRRFASEEILAKLAGALNVSLEDLKQYDNRKPIAGKERRTDRPRYLGQISQEKVA